ncbi:DUF1176 domain-containing protein [Chthonobacter rhizosphaerae]|uniref:DUF1176 domain-containing protein n=1 Tax=Chthonobacter rhizosphaerae TaxID=2735553 RepID=UPI0015EEAA15|nr:DUF1176 domain-containing protein [Chthonobacter rhizosphaerae]
MTLTTLFTGAGRFLLVLATLIGAAPSDAEAQTGTARYGSAEVACAEDLTCVASVRARDADGTVTSVFQLHRGPGSRSRWAVSVTTLKDLADRERPISMAVDGGVALTLRPRSDYAPFVNPGDFFVLSQYALDRLMRDIQVGFELRVTYIDIAGAPHMDRFRLDGMRDALTEIDRRQKRIVGDRRAGPPDDLPPAPEVDRQAMVALQGLPPRLVEWHIASQCEAPDGPSLAETPPVIGALSETAMLYAIPCYRSEGRTGYRLYMVESGEIGGMHLLTFATFSSRFGWMGTDTLETVAFDPQTATLTAVTTGAAPDCGTAGTWRWDQYAFKLVTFRANESCGTGKAPADWPVVFPGPGGQ